MARLEDGSDQALVEVKAVDGAYPLYGALATEPALPQRRAVRRAGRRLRRGGARPPVRAARPAARRRASSSARATFELRAKLVTRAGRGVRRLRLRAAPDGLARRACARRAWSSPAAWSSIAYKVRLAGTAPARPRSTAIRERAGGEFPAGRLERSARAANAAPALSANIERFSQFLTLVGLTALVVGGVGVANAVRAYLDGKRGVIATFKSLGASGGFVFTVYLVQILIIAGDRHRRSAWRSAR